MMEKIGLRPLDSLSLPRWQARCLGWMSLGLWIFVTAFLWAPSRDGLEGVYVLAFFIPGILLLLWNWRPGDIDPINGVALAYAAFCVLSSTWSLAPAPAYFLLQWLVLAVWLLGVRWLHQQRPLDLDGLFNLLVLIGAAVSVTILVEFYWDHPFAFRLMSWTVARNPIVVGQVFGVIALLGFIRSWQVHSRRQSLVMLVAAMLACLPLLFSQSRGPILALGLALGLAWILIRPSWQRTLPQVVVLAVVGAGLLATDTLSMLVDRAFSFTGRDTIWLEILGYMPGHLWLGIGVAETTHIQASDGTIFHHAHNAWLDTLYRTGLIGLALLLVHLVLVLRHFDPHSPLLALYLWLFFGVACLLTDGRLLFWQLDAKWFLYWIPAGLIAACVVHPRQGTQAKTE